MSTGSGGTACTSRPGVECEALGINYVCGSNNRCEQGSFLQYTISKGFKETAGLFVRLPLGGLYFNSFIYLTTVSKKLCVSQGDMNIWFKDQMLIT